MSEADVRNKPLVAIVDDDESIRVAIGGLMRSLGCAAADFASAEDFVASPYLDSTSCLIVDVNMPGMSGPELQQHLLASNPAIPTIVITAYPDDQVRNSVLAAGAVAYLTKPFDETDLLRYVRWALGKTRLRGQT
jgi:FixJ family two-component response regulator